MQSRKIKKLPPAGAPCHDNKNRRNRDDETRADKKIVAQKPAHRNDNPRGERQSNAKISERSSKPRHNINKHQNADRNHYNYHNSRVQERPADLAPKRVGAVKLFRHRLQRCGKFASFLSRAHHADDNRRKDTGKLRKRLMKRDSLPDALGESYHNALQRAALTLALQYRERAGDRQPCLEHAAEVPRKDTFIVQGNASSKRKDFVPRNRRAAPVLLGKDKHLSLCFQFARERELIRCLPLGFRECPIRFL